MNLIFGGAGFAKEVEWLIQEIYESTGTDYRTDFFVAEDDSEIVGSKINSCIVLSESEVLYKFSGRNINCFIAVGNPVIREIIYRKLKSSNMICSFPNLVHPDVSFDSRPGRVVFGEGSIICAKNVITTDIKIGSFVHINLDCTVGHDSFISDFSTISPGVHISGNVYIGEKVFLGTGAVILEKISICSGAIIGAGATVSKIISEAGTYVGTPAKRIK